MNLLRIIHTGGEPELVPDPHTFVDTSVAVPRAPQRLRPAFFRSERLMALKLDATKARRYGPVRFLDKADDQCAWPLASGLRCGLKATRGSYCDGHFERGHRVN